MQRTAEGAQGGTIGVDKEGLECHAKEFSLYPVGQWFLTFSSGKFYFQGENYFLPQYIKLHTWSCLR